MSVLYRCWAEVDLDALRSNLAWLRHRVGPGVKILTVVKADAYGHGLKQIAAVLMQSGTDIFGVANLTEARHVRSVGAGWPILMLGACLPHEVEAAVKDGIMPAVSSVAEARAFSDAAVRWGRVVSGHLKIDTGMGRLGMDPSVAVRAACQMAKLKGFQVAGLMTHFAAAEDDPEFTDHQQRKFIEILDRLQKAGIRPPLVHVCNSGGLLWKSSARFNLVRPGLLVYGVIPPTRRPGHTLLHRRLKPALTWKCRVGLVKTVAKGTPISYGHTYYTPRRMRVAVITAGYGDGYMRSGSQRASVLIRGHRCPVLGRITMDQMIVDAGPAAGVRPGEEVVLVGKQGRETISIGELASWCGTIPWEALTNITYRVPRIYLGGHAA